MYTYVPGLPPLQVRGSPWVLSILAEGLGLVAVSSGFDNLMVDVKGPTSAPPEPLNVKVPPVWGMAPAGNCVDAQRASHNLDGRWGTGVAAIGNGEDPASNRSDRG
jgi:hypothetical protein